MTTVVMMILFLQPDPNAKPNLNPVQTAPPVLIRTARNGKLFKVGDGDDSIDLLHVWGIILLLDIYKQKNGLSLPSNNSIFLVIQIVENCASILM